MLNKTKSKQRSKYLQQQKIKNSIAINLKLCYIDMHVDDLIDMAIRLNVIKDDSDLSEGTFLNLVHFVEDMYNKTPRRNANPMDYFHKAAFRYKLVADNVLADA